MKRDISIRLSTRIVYVQEVDTGTSLLIALSRFIHVARIFSIIIRDFLDIFLYFLNLNIVTY